MGELNFTPATYAASLITSSGKILVRQSLGTITTSGRTVSLSDDMSNYNILLVSLFGKTSKDTGNDVEIFAGDNTSSFITFNIRSSFTGGMGIFAKMNSVYVYGRFSSSSGGLSYGVNRSLIAGNTCRIVPPTQALNNAEFSIYGLKFS